MRQLKGAMPFGLCGKQNVTEEIHASVELLDQSVLQVALSRDAKGLECLEKVTEQLGITEVSDAITLCRNLAGFVVLPSKSDDLKSTKRSLKCSSFLALPSSVPMLTASVRYQSCFKLHLKSVCKLTGRDYKCHCNHIKPCTVRS